MLVALSLGPTQLFQVFLGKGKEQGLGDALPVFLRQDVDMGCTAHWPPLSHLIVTASGAGKLGLHLCRRVQTIPIAKKDNGN